MLLTGAVFLLNLLCGLVPCDPQLKPPDTLPEPKSLSMTVRNYHVRGKPPIARTPNGVLDGYFMKAMNGRIFVAFEGIPYGEAERWKVAKPTKPWNGIRQAKNPGPFCLQIHPLKIFRVIGSEQCLTVNVYTPQLPDSSNDYKKYPVIVFIHGGAFIFSSGAEFGPTYILSEDTILVTFNYRLGVLGFLSADKVPGNLGLKDQALALKWVHENIESFGGNKFNVSLWGQSSGAASVGLHLISEKTRNYFSTAFSTSATAFNHFSVQSQKRMRELTYRFAKNFNCHRVASWDMRRCLERVDVNLLVARQYSLYDWYPFPPVTFSPTVEPEHPDAFLTMTPTEAYQAGIVSKKPLIVGMVRDEGKGILIMLLPLLRMFPLRAMWNQIAPVFLQLNGVVNNPNEVVSKIEQFYFKGQDSRTVNMTVFGEMIGDRFLNSGIVQGVQAHSSIGLPTYMYLFSFSEGNHNLVNFIGYQSKEWGVGHIEDITYLFNMTIVDAHQQTDPDHVLSSVMINLLVNFATTGKPMFKTEKGEYLEVWDTVSNASQIKALQLDKDIKMVSLPQTIVDRIKFWSNLNVPYMT